MKNNKNEMHGHLNRNKEMWKDWEKHGVTPDIELTVNFHFYAASSELNERLCKILTEENIPFRVKKTRTLLFLKGWEIEADITQKWTFAELQGKAGNMFLLSKQTGVCFEGCGAFMPE
ncbi:MAG: hypothetical protein GY754_12535 [bacterium]|nr:hypothetical protein [bacterium]